MIKWTLRQNWVLGLGIMAFLIPVAITEWMVLHHTNGVFSYALDDAFIHLAIAKNLAFHHVWGSSPQEFASAASSILYPLILAAVLKIFGAHIIIPFIINLLTGVILLVVLQKWLQKQKISPEAQLVILLGVIFLTPLPVLVISGMEHTLQLLFSFLFIFTFSDCLGSLVNSGEKGWKLPWSLFLYGALLMATRYESVSIIAVACVILLVHKKVVLSCKLGFLSLLPILIFGIYSIYKGSYFIPNSVLLKSEAPPMTTEGLFDFFTEGLFFKISDSRVGYNTIATQRLLFILPLIYLLFINQIRKALSYRYILIILIAGVFMHLSCAATAKFPRFEAYLIGCSILIVGVLFAKFGKEVIPKQFGNWGWVTSCLALFLIFPFFIRGKESFRDISQACINIYEQQYQMGRFLHDHYYTVPVAINDIGAVSYLTEGKNLDLIGLGSLDVARSRKGFYYSPDFLDWLSKKEKVKIAIVYDKWFYSALLQRWNKTATWQIPDNVMCADDHVTFYAVDSAAKPDLLKNLQDFQRLLPTDVAVKYY
jgi:hypothetical protein